MLKAIVASYSCSLAATEGAEAAAVKTEEVAAEEAAAAKAARIVAEEAATAEAANIAAEASAV